MTADLAAPAPTAQSFRFVLDPDRSIRRGTGVEVAVCTCGKGRDEHETKSDIGNLGEQA